MIDALENEDAFYQFENYSLKKQRGYYIYYETNQEMKNYMLAEGEMGRMPERGRSSDTIKRDTAVVKNYKKVLKKKKKLHKKSAFQNPTYIAGGLVAAMVFVYGIHSVVQFQNSQKMQSVFSQQEVTDARIDSAKEADTVDKTVTEQTGQEESSSQNANSESTVSNTENTAAASAEQSSAQQEEGKNSSTEQTSDTEESKETWNSIGGYYTVKRGDTLAGISKKMYQSYNYIEMIAEANGIENVDEIYPGQILEIPQIED